MPHRGTRAAHDGFRHRCRECSLASQRTIWLILRDDVSLRSPSVDGHVPSGCLFCELAANRARTPHWVARSPRALALLSVDPASRGHTVIFSKRHVSDLSTIPESEWIAVNRLTLRVVALLRKSLGSRGEYLYCGSWTQPGRKYPHLHLHVIPRGRRLASGFDEWWHPPPEGSAPMAELAALAQRIRSSSRS